MCQFVDEMVARVGQGEKIFIQPDAPSGKHHRHGMGSNAGDQPLRQSAQVKMHRRQPAPHPYWTAARGLRFGKGAQVLRRQQQDCQVVSLNAPESFQPYSDCSSFAVDMVCLSYNKLSATKRGGCEG